MRTKTGDKRQQILDAAIIVFAEDGYFNAKMHRIADAAGVAAGTVYLYYRDKEKILLDIFEIVWEYLFHEIKIISKESAITPTQKLNAIVETVFTYFTDNRELALVFVNEQNHLIEKEKEQFTHYYANTLEIIDSVVKNGKDAQTFDSSFDSTIFSYFFFGGLRYVLQHWAHDYTQISLEEIKKNFKQMILCGILKR